MFPYKTMSLYRTLQQAARLTPVLALGLALGGCSTVHRWIGHGDNAGPAAPMTPIRSPSRTSPSAGIPA